MLYKRSIPKTVFVTHVALYFLVASSTPLYADSDLHQGAHTKVTVGHETKELPIILGQSQTGAILASSQGDLVFSNGDKVTYNYLLSEIPDPILTVGWMFQIHYIDPVEVMASVTMPLWNPIAGDSVPAACAIAGSFADGTAPQDGVSVNPSWTPLVAQCKINDIGVLDLGPGLESRSTTTTYPQNGGSFSASTFIDCGTIGTGGTCNSLTIQVGFLASAGSDVYVFVGTFCLNGEACLIDPMGRFSEVVQRLIPHVLTQEIGRGMIEKLEQVLEKLSDEEPPPVDLRDEACNQLEALITQIEQLVNDRWLTEGEARPLLDVVMPIWDFECRQ